MLKRLTIVAGRVLALTALLLALAATAGLPDRPSSSRANAAGEASQSRPMPSLPPPSPFQEWQ